MTLPIIWWRYLVYGSTTLLYVLNPILILLTSTTLTPGYLTLHVSLCRPREIHDTLGLEGLTGSCNQEMCGPSHDPTDVSRCRTVISSRLGNTLVGSHLQRSVYSVLSYRRRLSLSRVRQVLIRYMVSSVGDRWKRTTRVSPTNDLYLLIFDTVDSSHTPVKENHNE